MDVRVKALICSNGDYRFNIEDKSPCEYCDSKEWQIAIYATEYNEELYANEYAHE